MDSLFLYFLESTLVLTVLYVIYLTVLQRETFFSMNRIFLLFILLFSVSIPFLSYELYPTQSLTANGTTLNELSNVRASYYDAFDDWSIGLTASNPAETASVNTIKVTSLSWLSIVKNSIIYLYLIGILFCLSRMLWIIRVIVQLINSNQNEKLSDFTIVHLSKPMAPFSFLKYVFIHKETISPSEYDQILAHERIHVIERHTIDLIIVQLIATFFWFNPVIWKLIKSLKTTHEYIADSKIIGKGYSLVEYQTLLLNQLISNNSYGLVHNFNLSFIKKRITMMKNKKSGFVGKVKVALVLAGTVAFSALIIQCNAVVDQQEMIDTEKSSTLASQNEINLPVIPNENNHEAHDVTQSLSFEISNNALTIDGKSHTVAEVKAAVEESGLPREGIIVMIIDENQKMGLVYEVSREIQKAKRRKILYMGTDVDGNSTEIAMLLPPIPGYTDAGDPILAKIDEAHIAKYDLELLTFHVGKDHSVENQNQVYDFLKDQVARNRSNYVICVKYEDEDTYGQYLTNLYFVNQGFNLIYQERAQELFGKDLFSLDKVDYTAARKGIPRAISIADMETDR